MAKLSLLSQSVSKPHDSMKNESMMKSDVEREDSDPRCSEADDIGAMMGQLLALAVLTAVLAWIPMSVLNYLHRRDFKQVDYEGEREKQQAPLRLLLPRTSF